MRLDNLQALRGIAASAVYFVHYEDIERKYGGGQTLLGPWADVGAWGVDLFFALSGFVMVFVLRNKEGSVQNALNFLWARASRIYPLWWLCLSALVVLWLVKPNLVYGGADPNPNLFKDYLLIPREMSPLLQTGWTLIYEMYFYAFFTLLLLLPIGQKERLKLLLAWGASIAIFASLFKFEYGTLLWVATNPMALHFLLGALAAYAWQKFEGAKGLTVLVLGTLILCVSMYADIAELDAAYVTPGDNSENWARLVLYGPAAALIIYGAASIESKSNWRAHTSLRALGDWSFSLYLTHMLTVNAAGFAWGFVAMPGLLDNIIALPVVFAFCTFCSWLTYRFFEQPVLRMTKAQGRAWLSQGEPQPQ